jgi:hypothetical protein
MTWDLRCACAPISTSIDTAGDLVAMMKMTAALKRTRTRALVQFVALFFGRGRALLDLGRLHEAAVHFRVALQVMVAGGCIIY